jgi:hypothetical protein
MQAEILTMLYDWPTWLIVLGLLAAMLASNEIGFRGARWEHKRENDLSRTVSNALKASIFGFVALLLAFCFSATNARYDVRQRLVLDQANAIGTCYLRAGLLDDASKTRIQGLLRKYVDLRLEQYQAADDREVFDRRQAEIGTLLSDLWTAVEEANREAPDEVRNSLIVPAANEVIDLSSTRSWANRNHPTVQS